ncbi:MAG: hypothetical protein KC646_00645 [Candidatus Cloacimonetes bacterium]|nr:hypothetical protein [Candidatus Cloacimonadota bacterium]
MKNLISLIVLFLTLGLSTNYAKGIPFLLQIDKKGVKAIDIPKKYNWKSANLEYLHIGYEWEQVSFLFIPVWNTTGTYKAWVDTGKGKVLNLRADLLQDILDKTGKSLPRRAPISFWEKYGGKAVAIPIWLFLLTIYISFSHKKNNTKS